MYILRFLHKFQSPTGFLFLMLKIANFSYFNNGDIYSCVKCEGRELYFPGIISQKFLVFHLEFLFS